MNPLYRIYRRGLTIFWTATTILLVLLAVVAGLAELLLPYTDKYQLQIETKLSEFAGQPVHFAAIEGSWDVTGPQFNLSELAIYSDTNEHSKPEILINQARVKFSLLNYLIPNRPFTRFEIVGAELELQRDELGVLKISGFNSEKPMALGEILERLSAVEQLHLSNTRLILVDKINTVRQSLTASSAEIQYKNGLFLARWQAAIGDSAETSDTLLKTEPAGESEGKLSLRLDKSKPQSVSAWAKTHITKPGQLLTVLPEEWRNTASGEVDVEAWLEWQAGQPLHLQGNLLASDLRWKMQSDDQLAQLDGLETAWRLHFEDRQHWSLSLANLSAVTDGKSKLEGTFTLILNPDLQTRLYLQTGKIDLGFSQSLLTPLVRQLNISSPFAGKFDGDIDHLLLEIDSTGQISWLETTVDNLRLSNSDDWPNFGPLNLTAEISENSGFVNLKAEDFGFSWARAFSQPQVWDDFSCNLDIGIKAQHSWQIQTQFCELENKDIAVGLELGLFNPIDHANGQQQSTQVDAQFFIHHINAPSLKNYWPDKVMKKKGTRWLKQAFPAGEVRDGFIQIVGALDRFPFKQGGGVFSGRLPAYDISLKFHPKWPLLEQTNAVVKLENMRLLVQSKSLQTAGISIQDASSIVDMNGRLNLTVDFSKTLDANALVQYIHRSPLEEMMGLGLDAFSISGPALTTGHLAFYMDGRKDWFDVSGNVDFEDAQFELPDWSIKLEDINGSLLWSEHGISATNIETSMNGSAGLLELSAGPEKTGGQILRAGLSINSPIEHLIPPFLKEQLNFSEFLRGETQWDVAVLIEQKLSDGTLPLSLNVSSELQGLSSNLPAPLTKSASEIWPTSIHLPIQGVDRQLVLRIDNRLGVKMKLDSARSTAEAVQVFLGGAKVSEPRQGYFSMGGLTQEFDLDGWLMVLSNKLDVSTASSLELGNLVFEARELGFMGAQVADTRLEIQKTDESYQALFSGPAISGSIQLPGGKRKALVADFDYLRLPVVEAAEEIDSADNLPKLKPGSLPPLHLYAREFEWGHLKLKETRIETHPIANGLRIETLEGTSGSVHLLASGDWLESAQTESTNLKLNITSESFDEMLQVFDFSAGITGGQSILNLESSWQSSPLDIDINSFNGNMGLSVKGGSLTAANPGAGRLLGLMSLQALPRRLMLDFRDVFDEGFHFDSADGHFTIENGIASTDDLKIKSPAADILITGSTNMLSREYDQLVRVRPGVGSALPVIGALTAGPGGAAAGLALQGLFKKALGEAAEAVYQITGSWDNPEIIQIEKPKKSRNQAATELPVRKNTP